MSPEVEYGFENPIPEPPKNSDWHIHPEALKRGQKLFDAKAGKFCTVVQSGNDEFVQVHYKGKTDEVAVPAYHLVAGSSQ
jgi:hypothetical protein